MVVFNFSFLFSFLTVGCLVTLINANNNVSSKTKRSTYFIGSDEEGNPKNDLMVETMTLPNPEGGAPQMVNCRIFGDEKVISALTKNPIMKDTPTKQLNGQDMATLVEKCTLLQLSLFKTNTRAGKDGSKGEKSFLDGLAIYPGTKWCGADDIAKNYDDLGTERATDMCCREHDHCPKNIFAGESKYGLKNTAIYTKTHCDCDWKFVSCLKKTESGTSDAVGKLFFNLLQVQCFKEEHPVVQCKSTRMWLLRSSCQEYEFDTTKPKISQFLDSRFYD